MNAAKQQHTTDRKREQQYGFGIVLIVPTLRQTIATVKPDHPAPPRTPFKRWRDGFEPVKDSPCPNQDAPETKRAAPRAGPPL
jgi:hypothetical protein